MEVGQELEDGRTRGQVLQAVLSAYPRRRLRPVARLQQQLLLGLELEVDVAGGHQAVRVRAMGPANPSGAAAPTG